MALSFTSEQIKSISDEYLSISSDIAKAQADKAAMIVQKNDMKKEDDKNKVFYDNYKNIVSLYHSELALCVGKKRTNYSDSNIDPAAQLAPGNIHFPNDYRGFSPKYHESLNGLGETQLTEYERMKLPPISNEISLFKNGFVDGNTTAAGTMGVTGNSVPITGGGISIGNRIMVNGGSNSFMATVTGVSSVSGNDTLTVQFMYPSSPVAIGGSITVKNFWSGFNNTERESQTSSTYQQVMNDFTSKILFKINEWRSYVSNQLDVVVRNDAAGPEKKEISDTISNLQRTLSVIDAWKNSPNTGVGVGKYGNNKINTITDEIVKRDKDIGVRFGQIINRLGSISQNSKFEYSGSGNYLQVVTWLDFRINKVSGSLRKYYASDLGISVFDQKIASLIKKEAELKTKFTIHLFAEDSQRTDSIKMKDVKGFVVNDIVSIAAVDLDLIKAKIVSIGNDNILKFDTIIPDAFKVDAGARVIKQV